MNLLHSSDPRLMFAFWLGVSVVVAALVMLVLILLMRQWAERNARNHERAATFWRRILAEAAHDLPAQVPPLPRRDLTGFIDAWNDLHATLDGAENVGMRHVAEQVGLERKLYLAVDHGGFHNRVMSIIAMGHLRSTTHFEKLSRLLRDGSPIVSLSAARALMQIDPEHAVQLVVPQIVARQDWLQGGVAEILGSGDPASVSRELGNLTLQANDDVAPRLVRFLAGVSPGAATPVIRKVLAERHDEHLVSTCLQVMTEPQDLGVVRPLLAHPRWHVRMHAATAVGRLGTGADAQGLMPLLADAQWWVRYRAAQAVSRLAGGDHGSLARIRAVQVDRYACDILDQVMAEQAVGATS